MCEDKAAEKAKIDSTPDFRVYAGKGLIKDVTFYFIEGTAPDNVEQRVNVDDAPPEGLTRVDTDDAVKEIAETLAPLGDPDVEADLVVMVHGFNTPRKNARDFFARAVQALMADQKAIFTPGRRIVCVGYRWPSEAMFRGVLGSSFWALPLFPRGVLLFSAAVLLMRVLGWATGLANFLTPLAVVLLAVIVVLAALRAIVYFRDVYRATNYGVPDLVEVIRQIDRQVSERVDAEPAEVRAKRKRIALSFIGHSMGGLVVTNTIRVLSDVFDPDVITTFLSGKTRENIPAAAGAGGTPPGLVAGDEEEGPDDTPKVSSKIGHVFTLMRFLLASPDIPAEALLADRANFLASSLHRFREAYLFSSEGDEVLRLISTTANYFSFPTGDRVYGYRLGNAEILSSGFGEIPPRRLLEKLRAGAQTLAYLSGKTRRKSVANLRRRIDPAGVAKIFSYFDCTDYVDGPDRRGMLTEALNRKERNPKGHLSYFQHIRLLWRYLQNRVDVHGGYFDGEVSQRLIYRLACLGWEGAVAAYDDRDAMMKECDDHGIRAMLSKRLGSVAARAARELMDTKRGAADRANAELLKKLREIGALGRLGGRISSEEDIVRIISPESGTVTIDKQTQRAVE